MITLFDQSYKNCRLLIHYSDKLAHIICIQCGINVAVDHEIPVIVVVIMKKATTFFDLR